jgi:Tfp pilus assembly protein PilF
VAKPQSSKVITEQKPADTKKVIARLEAGRTGFVITETPKSLRTWSADFERAVALMQEDKEKQAMPILEEIVRQSPGVTAPYINLAMIYRHAEQYEQAEKLLQEALKLVPGHPVANNEYGLVLRQTGRFEEAREVYEATLQMFPEYLPVHRNLGILCELYLGDTACAVEQYTIYSKAKPDNQTVALWIADLNLRTGSN